MRSRFDPKRAASGERDEDAVVALAPTRSLLEALKPTSSSQRSNEENNASKSPVQNSGKRRIVESLYESDMAHLPGLMKRHPDKWMHYMSRHLTDDREIVASFGKRSDQGGLPIAFGVVLGSNLTPEQLPLPFAVSDKTDPKFRSSYLHPLVRQFYIKRNQLIKDNGEPFNGIVLEIALWSRLVKDDLTSPDQDLQYIGKAKLHFPMPHSSMVFYVDLSMIK